VATPHNNPSSAPGGAPAANPQEQRAREFLAQGRFRKARDELKILCKADRARYLPLLVEANVGLAREMMSKGQVSEAQQVVAYLKTIATPEQLRVVELELAGKTGDYRAHAGDYASCCPIQIPSSSPPTRSAWPTR